MQRHQAVAARRAVFSPPTTRPGFLVLTGALARYMVEKDCCTVVLTQGSVLEWNQCLSMLLSSAARAAASCSPRERPLARTAGWRSQIWAARPAPAGLARLSHPGSRLSLSHRARPPLPEGSAARAAATRPCTGQEASLRPAPSVVRAIAGHQCTDQGASLRPAAPAPGEAAAADSFGGPRLAIRSGPARRAASPARATD